MHTGYEEHRSGCRISGKAQKSEKKETHDSFVPRKFTVLRYTQKELRSPRKKMGKKERRQMPIIMTASISWPWKNVFKVLSTVQAWGKCSVNVILFIR